MSIRFLCIALTALPALMALTPSQENSFRAQHPAGPAPALGFSGTAWGVSLGGFGFGQESEQEAAEEEHPQVKSEVLFDVEKFVPGKTAHLVVVLQVPKDWHIYWETAGESGMSTSLNVTGPKGWTIGRAHFPGPTLYEDSQGNLNHTLEGELGFFVPITPPDDAKPGEQAEFQVRMQWLQCQEICLMGTFEGKATLPIGKGMPKRNTDRRLVPLRGRLPRRGMIPTDVGYSFGGDLTGAEIAFSTQDARTFEFFALPDSPFVLENREEGSETPTFSQRNFVLKPNQTGATEKIHVQGILRVQRKDHVAFYEVDFQGPQTRAPEKHALGHGSLPTVPQKQ